MFRRILSFLADIFIAGRNAGLFREGQGPQVPKK